MKNLQTILANLLILTFIVACAKKESIYPENQTPNLDFEEHKLQLQTTYKLADSNGFLIDERPFYDL